MIYTPADAALLVRRNGGTDEEAVFLASVMPGESGGNPEVINWSSTCGPNGERAVGLFQICSFASRGTVDQLQDPHHNARQAINILWAQGERAWTAEPDSDAADEARQALAGGRPMENWMPGVTHIDRGGSVPVQDDGPTVFVIHTTETDGPASYAGTEPHFEVHDTGSDDLLDGTIQYISLAHTAKALYNAAGGGETNRRRGRIIQIEVVWRAANAPAMPDSLLRRVAAVVAFGREQFPDLQIIAPPQGFHGADEGIYPYLASEESPIRFSIDAWEDFGGICGHQHVIENDHWDPGRFPIARFIALMGIKNPTDEEEPVKVLKVIDVGDPAPLYMLSGVTAHHIPSWNPYLALVGKKLLPGPDEWVEVTQAELDQYVVL